MARVVLYFPALNKNLLAFERGSGNQILCVVSLSASLFFFCSMEHGNGDNKGQKDGLCEALWWKQALQAQGRFSARFVCFCLTTSLLNIEKLVKK